MFSASAEELSIRDNYRLIHTAVAPRPIAWISTTDGNGVDNLAPYSAYNFVGSRRPVVMFSSSRKNENGDVKDTAKNIFETGEFVVNVVTESMIEEMDHSSMALPAEESEFDRVGLERAESVRVTPPRVADSPISMECELYDSTWIYYNLIIFGEVVHYQVDDELMTDGKVDATTLDLVGRLGGPYYTRTEFHELERQY